MKKTERVRCERSDDGADTGCVREARHKGRCTIRPGARAAFASGEIPPLRPGGAASGSAPTGRATGGGIDALTRRVEAEVSALVADCERVVEIIRGEAGVIKARNLGLLKLAVRCRRRIARLGRSLKSARGAAAADRLAKEVEAEDETEDDDDETA
ncbi:MAG: hypothetical protein IMZ66_02750 [Planctomycetes bacterium]|nr:hypothetical protein [Planctomycetota bacterium]